MIGLSSIGLGALILYLVLWPSKTTGKTRLETFLGGLGYTASAGGTTPWASGGQSWDTSSPSGGGPGASSGWDDGDSSKGAQAVASALKQIGTPYVWGGAAIGGFDCSGLTQWAYQLVGVRLPRTAQQQYNALRATSSPQVGDLVFFEGTYPTGDYITHVGLYLGGGRMVSSQTGGVLIGDLTSGYWKDHLVGFRSVGQ